MKPTNRQLGCAQFAGATSLDEWPNCVVADCPAKSCLSLASDKCWPHTVGLPLDWADGLSERQIRNKRNYYERKWIRRRS